MLLDVTLVVLCAGNSTRFEHKTKKQWLRIENEPLWLNVTKRLASFSKFDKIIVASHDKEETTVVDLDLKESNYFRMHWPFLRDRRIDSYQPITKRFIDED